MQQDILFSIIVVSYQPGDKLQKTIESVLCQSETSYEILVKDGGSTDGAIEALPADPRIRVQVSLDSGIYDAMNQAVSEAGGQYFLFLNCGDYLYEDSTLTKIREKLSGSGLYYGHTYNRSIQAEVTMNAHLTSFSCYRHVPCHQACIYSRDLFDERAYNTKYLIRADYEHFLWCYFQKKAPFVFIDHMIASYEGAGFSELAANRKRDKSEHKEITIKYMGHVRVLLYQLMLMLSLVHVRRFLGSSPTFADKYNKIKKRFYIKKAK